MQLSITWFSLLLHQNPNQMKKRMLTVLNFLAFNLLFFALYLNFIHRDNNSAAVIANHSKQVSAKGTVVIDNPDAYLKNQKQHTALLQ